MSKDSKDPWIDPARATFLYTVVKGAVEKRRSTQDQGRGEEGSGASPDAPTRSVGRPAQPRRGDSPFVMTYLLGMWLNLTLAAFHIRGYLPIEVEWVVAGWFLAGITVFVVFLLLSSKDAGLKYLWLRRIDHRGCPLGGCDRGRADWHGAYFSCFSRGVRGRSQSEVGAGSIQMPRVKDGSGAGMKFLPGK